MSAYQQMKIPFSKNIPRNLSTFQLPRMSLVLLPIIQHQKIQISLVYKNLLQMRDMRENIYKTSSFHFHQMGSNPCFAAINVMSRGVWCDVTSHSNNKGFSLLTFSCGTSVDKQVVFF